MKRRLSSVDVDIDTPVGSLSKKSRRGKDANASDDEEPTSSPITSSPHPPRSSPPPEDVKEVTTGVKDIELDQKPDVPVSDPSEVVEPLATLVTETSAEADEEVKTDTEEGSTPEQRSGEGSAPEVEGSQDPVKGDTADKVPVKLVQEPIDDSKGAIKTPEQDTKPLAVNPASPTKISDPKSTATGQVVSEDKPEAEA